LQPLFERPLTQYLPVGKNEPCAGSILVIPGNGYLPVEIGADKVNALLLLSGNFHRGLQEGGKSDDVVVPEDLLDLGQVSLIDEDPILQRIVVHTAYFQRDGLALGNHVNVGPV